MSERLEDRRLLAVLFAHDEGDAVRVIVPSDAAYNNIGLDWTGGAEPFDDSAWAVTSGAPNGVGYDRGTVYDSLLGADLESAMYDARTSMFVRATFDVTDPAAVDQLTLNLRYDDGFIAWLNGVEVARANAATIYPAWSDTATGPHEASITSFEAFDLAAAIVSLRAGANVLAIRGLNISMSDDDALLQFTLVGESRTGPPLAVDDTATTDEGVPVTIDVLANDQDGSGAINPASVVVATPPVHGTAVANSDGTITYTPNPVYNGPDTFTYTVRDGIGVGQPTQRTLVSPTSAGKALVPTGTTPNDAWRGGSQTFDDSAWQSGPLGVGYETASGYESYIGINVSSAMYNLRPSVYVRTTFSLESPADVTALVLGMRYDDGFAAFINGVRVASNNAPGELAYNSVATADRPDADAITFQSFDVTPFVSALVPGINTLAIHGLNSAINSSDMLVQPLLTATVQPRGQLSNAASVTINVVGIDYPPIARNDEYEVDEGEALNVSATSGGGEPTTATLIASGATWRYRDTGQLPANDAQGDNWTQVAYDDPNWSSGRAELGYGDNDEATVISFGPDGNNKYVTSWFRHTFTLDAASAAGATSLFVELLRDDGGAVYINGVEVARDNLPGAIGDNALTPDTFAAQTTSETTYFPHTVDLSAPRYENLLRAGDNVVAVEIHQTDRVSSDVSFDLRLSATIELMPGVLGNDTEPDEQSMSAVLETSPVHGTLTLDLDGTFIYTPNAGFVGVDTFTYKATDGALSSDPATVTVAVNHVPPIAAADSYQTDEDAPLVIGIAQGLLANDSDTQNHPLTAIVDAPPLSGTVTLQSDGSFGYVPAANFHGVDVFSYRVSDGAQNSAAAIVTITVNSVDDPPVATVDSYSGVEGQTLVVDGRVGPATAAADFLGLHEVGTYTAAGSVSQIVFAPKYGLLFIRDGGARVRIIDVATQMQIGERLPIESFTDFDVSPDDEFLFVADYGGTNIGYGSPARPSYVHRFRLATRTWETKTAPEIAYRLEAVDGDRFLLLEQDQSVDLTLNSYRSTGSPIVELSRRGGYQGNIDYVPRSARVLYAESGLSSISIQTWTVSGNTFVSGTGRGFSSGGSVVGSTDGQYYFFGGMQLLAANVQQTIRSYPNSVAAAPGGLAITSTGAIFNAANGMQLGTLPYATSTFAVDEQDLHLWAFESTGNRLHHYLLPIYGRGLLANDFQPEYAIMTAEVVSGPAHGMLNLAPDGTFHYTPSTGFFGVDSFTYVATSSEGTSAPTTVTLNIAHGGPTTVTEQYQVDEDGELEASAATGVLANDSDSQNHAIVATLDTSPTHGTLTFAPDGSFRYVPNANFHGTDTFTYRASDGEIISEPVTVTIVVNSIEEPPVAVDDDFTIDRGTSLYLGAPGVAVETIAQTSFAVPATGAVNFVATGGELGFLASSTPNATELGVLSSDEYVVRGNSSTFTLNFDEVDISRFQQVSVRLRVRTHEDSSGSDFEENDFFRAHVGLARVGGPVVLQSIVNLSGVQLKAIDAGATGAYTTYIAHIPEGFVTATLTIEALVDSSTERVFVDDIVIEGISALRGNLLLANDTDGDGDILSVRVVSPPMHGTITTDVNGATTYTPDTLFVGDDTFTYVANDGTADSNIATATIHVIPANLIPVASNDFYTTNEDTPLVVPPAQGVLVNDVDLDEDPLSPIIVSPPLHGTLSIHPSGAFIYRSNTNFAGTDSFTYRATDGATASDPATATITVTPVNDAPATQEDVYDVTKGQILSTRTTAISYAQIVDNSEPTAYFRLGEIGGTTAANAAGGSSGQYRNSPQLGVEGAIVGDVNSAVAFDGNNDFVEVPFSSTTNPDASFTVEAWAFPTRISGVWQAVVGSSDVPQSRGFAIYVGMDGRWLLSTGAGNRLGGDSYRINGPDVLTNRWQHVVFAYTSNSVGTDGVHEGTLRFYVNGQLAVVEEDVFYLPNISRPMRIGAAATESSSAAYNFSGRIDEVAVYPRALNDTEIYTHFEVGAAVLADSVAEFSGVQGRRGWQYGYYDHGADSDGVYQAANFRAFPNAPGQWSESNYWDAENKRWNWYSGDPPWTEVAAHTMRPSGPNASPEHWVVRRWVSNYAGAVILDFHLATQNDGGDGVRASVYVDGVSVSSEIIAAGNRTGVNRQLIATLVLGSQVDFVVAPLTTDLADDAVFTATIRADIEPPQPVTLIAGNSNWRYRDNIPNGSAYPVDAQGDRWHESDYDDSQTWSVGRAILGYGEIVAGQVSTTLQYGPDANNKYRTALFRQTFFVSDADRVTGLTLVAVFDDGAAVHINGREVLRHNLPGVAGDGTLRTDTLAPTAGLEEAYQTFVIDLAGQSDLLLDGANVIAVEVHQTSPSSTDLGFDLAVSANVLPAPLFPGLLANDVDPEGDLLDATLVAGPYHGTLVLHNDGSFNYIPAGGFEGVDQFTYRASDDTSDSPPTLVTINVGDANEAPLGFDDWFIVRRGTVLVIPAAMGLLANDFDFNGDALTATSLAQPAHGALSLSADGAFVYTPQPGFVGREGITYRVSDDVGTFGFATATIVVVSQIDPIGGIPVAAADVYQASAAAVLSVAAPGVLANDRDPEERAIAAVVQRAPWHGTLSLAVDGSFAYTPRPGFSGQDSFIYRASDGNALSDPTTVTIEIAAAIPPGGIIVPVPPGSTAPGTFIPGTTPPGSTTLPIVGDVNRDGLVDRGDLAVVVAAYGSVIGSPRFPAAADLNADGLVSLADAIAVQNRMEELSPAFSPAALIHRVRNVHIEPSRGRDLVTAIAIRQMETAASIINASQPSLLRAAKRIGATGSLLQAATDQAFSTEDCQETIYARRRRIR